MITRIKRFGRCVVAYDRKHSGDMTIVYIAAIIVLMMGGLS